jgi:hypothetical protein
MTPRDAGVAAWLEKADSDLLCIENNVAASRVPWDAAVRYPDPVYSPTEEDGRETTAAAFRLRATSEKLLEERTSL